MWEFIQSAQQAVFDAVAPVTGPAGMVESAVASGDMSRVSRVCQENGLHLPNVRGGNGKNMLHVACGRGHYEMTQYLLSSGVDIRGVTNNQETCLHFAAKGGSLGIVKLCVENGVSVIAKNTSGQTAYDLAVGMYDVRQYLLPLQLQQDTSGPVPYFATTSARHAAQQYQEVSQIGGNSGANYSNGAASYSSQPASGGYGYNSNHKQHPHPPQHHQELQGQIQAGPGVSHNVPYGVPASPTPAGDNNNSNIGFHPNGPATNAGVNVPLSVAPPSPMAGSPGPTSPKRSDGGPAIFQPNAGPAASAQNGANGAPAAPSTPGVPAAPQPPGGQQAGTQNPQTSATMSRKKRQFGKSTGKKKISDYADGFGSSVGNAQLSAKFGNKSGLSFPSRNDLPPPPTELGGPGPSSFASAGATPITSRRYVEYSPYPQQQQQQFSAQPNGMYNSFPGTQQQQFQGRPQQQPFQPQMQQQQSFQPQMQQQQPFQPQMQQQQPIQPQMQQQRPFQPQMQQQPSGPFSQPQQQPFPGPSGGFNRHPGGYGQGDSI
jgi:hypothetical protein